MIKILVQAERRDGDAGQTYWVTTNEVNSEDEVVVAKFLRALADRYDPPRSAMRSVTFPDRLPD